jgi:hypothetical protein
VATRHPDHTIRAITALTVAVTERPWSITARDLEAPRAAGLDDASILHVVLQCANFCHLNRIADAVGVAADYPDRFGAPHVEPATPAYLLPFDPPAPGPGPIELALRPGTEVYEAWRAYALDRDTPSLDRRRRGVIARAVADRLGDLRERPAADPVDDLDHALVELADLTTLAPWKLGPSAYHRIRALGLADDAQVFDAVATASSCQVFSRIAVTLAGFARQS